MERWGRVVGSLAVGVAGCSDHNMAVAVAVDVVAVADHIEVVVEGMGRTLFDLAMVLAIHNSPRDLAGC